MKLYAIRHKATGQYMPLFRGGKGYTHWNPGRTDNVKYIAPEVGIPRLINGWQKAIRVAKYWAREPNLGRSFTYPDDGQLRSKDDGRKLEDIELILVVLNFQKSRVELK
jgi:hypothetical protein